MVEPADMTMPMLREMRAENATMHEQTRSLLKELDKRLTGVEAAQTSFRHALPSDTSMRRLLTGEFEQRSEDRERKVRELETHS